MSRSQKEKILTEFIAFTHAIPADASRICKKAGYRLEVAIDLFYNDQLAQVNAERSLQSRTKTLSGGFETALNAQFDQFQEPDDPTRMEMEGLMQYLDQLSLTPEDPRVLCLCHLVQAPRLGVIERGKFVQHWTTVLVKSTVTASANPAQTAEGLVQFETKWLAELEARFRAEPEYFQEIYRFIFDFGRDDGQKSLALPTAIAFWEMVLPLAPAIDRSVYKPEYLEWWIELLRSRNKSVSRDTWNLFLDFIVQLEDAFLSYDEMAAWPSLIDDYVSLAREKLKSQGMDVC